MSAAKGVEALANQQVVPEFRELVLSGAIRELEGLHAEMQRRPILANGRVDLYLDDITARIDQLKGLLP
jgi:hypothetical protein